MRISSYKKVLVAENEDALAGILMHRDERGGGEFWLAEEDGGFPCLAIIVSGDLSHVHYFPKKGHPGFRCQHPLDGGLPEAGHTTFIWAGCDPASGEHVPNKFVLPFSTSLRIAKEFFRYGSLPSSAKWFEL